MIVSAVRDFADGLARGFARYFTERNDFTTAVVVAKVSERRAAR